MIVSYNERDFPADTMTINGIEVQHPDTFLCHAYHVDPVAFTAAVREQRSAWRAPVVNVDALLQRYRALRLATVAALLESHREVL